MRLSVRYTMCYMTGSTLVFKVTIALTRKSSTNKHLSTNTSITRHEHSLNIGFHEQQADKFSNTAIKSGKKYKTL